MSLVCHISSNFFSYTRGLVLWRCVYSKGAGLEKIFDMSAAELEAWKKLTYPKYKHFSWCQGLGRHTQDEVISIMNDDLRALSSFLGDKQFLTGNEPCSDDCGVFGMVAQFVWNDLTSPYAKIIQGKLNPSMFNFDS